MSFCDWCASPMKRIGRIETGMAQGLGWVWLCTREDCGHEVEIIERDDDGQERGRIEQSGSGKEGI
jgi:hypothetical protein